MYDLIRLQPGSLQEEAPSRAGLGYLEELLYIPIYGCRVAALGHAHMLPGLLQHNMYFLGIFSQVVVPALRGVSWSKSRQRIGSECVSQSSALFFF